MSRSFGIGTRSRIIEWRMFLSANRYPPRIKSGAGFRRSMRSGSTWMATAAPPGRSCGQQRQGSSLHRRRSHTEMVMPRHIRSVTARRPRKIARPVQAAPPAVAAVAAAASTNEAELFDGLRQAFQATPDIPETPERARERYVWAIESLANYLEDIGADAAWIERIEELGWALEDLTTGVLSPLLEPTSSNSGPPAGPGPSSPG